MTKKTINITTDLPENLNLIEVSEDLKTVKAFHNDNLIMTILFSSSITISKAVYDLNKIKRDSEGEPINPDDWMYCGINIFSELNFEAKSRYTEFYLNDSNFEVFLQASNPEIDIKNEEDFDEFMEGLINDIAMRLSFNSESCSHDEFHEFIENKLVENANKEESLALSLTGYHTMSLLNFDDWVKEVDVDFQFSEDDFVINERISESDNIQDEWEYDFIIL